MSREKSCILRLIDLFCLLQQNVIIVLYSIMVLSLAVWDHGPLHGDSADITGFLFSFFVGFLSGENIGHSIRSTPPPVGMTLKSWGVVVNDDMIMPVSLMQRPNGCIIDVI